MRYQSAKARKRYKESKPVRDALIARVGKCEWCGASPQRPRHPVSEQNNIHCHELLSGGQRLGLGFDEPASLLVLCNHCNQQVIHTWPLVMQLGLIKYRAPWRYDRERVLYIRNPMAMDFVTESEVDEALEKLKWMVA